MLSKLFHSIENTKISMLSWVASFSGVLFIRYLLETISSPPLSGSATFDFLTTLHYGLFYITVGIVLTLIITCFIPKKSALVIRLTPFIALITILPPIIDLIATAGRGSGMMYLLDSGHSVWYDLITFFGPNLYNGITLGIRIEIAILVLSIGWLVFYFSRSVTRAICAGVVSYISLFVLVSIPSITINLVNMVHGFSGPVTAAMFTDFFMNSLNGSVLVHTVANPAVTFASIESFFYTHFNVVMGQVFLILSLFAGLGFFWKTQREKIRAVIANTRPERLTHYIAVAILGGAIAIYQGESISFGWMTVLSLITLAIAIKTAWIAAVFSNDIADVDSDKLSANNNSNRPLVSGALTVIEMRDIAIVSQIISIIAAILIGPTIAYLMITFSIMYAIYSLPPLRLKRIPFLSSALIAIACVVVKLTGFFFVTGSGNLRSFPLSWLLISTLYFFIISHVRELKDIEADMKTGIRTVANMLGAHRASKVIGGFAALASILYPIFILKSWFAASIFIPIGIVGAIIATKQNRPERAMFAIYLFGLAVLIAMLLA